MDTSRSESDKLQMELPETGRTSWIPVSGVARLLKVSRQRVYQLIGAGAIVARQVDRTWLVSYRSVESRMAMLRAESEGIDADR